MSSYKEFNPVSKQDKSNWYKLIFNEGVYLEFCGNIYEFSYGEADYDDTKYWHFQDINNGDEIKLKPVTVFFDISIGFLSSEPYDYDEATGLYFVYNPYNDKNYPFETKEEALEYRKNLEK